MIWFPHKATIWIQVFFFTQIKSENWQCRHPFSSETWQSSGKKQHLSPNWNVQMFGLGDQQKLHTNSKIHPAPNEIFSPGFLCHRFEELNKGGLFDQVVGSPAVRDMETSHNMKPNFFKMNRFPSTFHLNYIPQKQSCTHGKEKNIHQTILKFRVQALTFNGYNVGESQENGNKRFRAASDTFKRLTVETCIYIYIS